MQSNEALALKIQTGERDLLPLLWEQVKPFVAWMARRWVNAWRSMRPSLEVDDLSQCGYIALCEAVETYSTDENKSFTGWLAFYLKTHFAVEVGCRTRTQMNDPLSNALSLDAPASNTSDDFTLGDTVADPADLLGEVDEQIWHEGLSRAVQNALVSLPEEERAIIQARYFDGLTIKETGERFGVSGNAIRNSEQKALRKLRSGEPSAALRAAWYAEANLYKGTGLNTWRNTGCSVQEAALIWLENSETPRFCEHKKGEIIKKVQHKKW